MSVKFGQKDNPNYNRRVGPLGISMEMSSHYPQPSSSSESLSLPVYSLREDKSGKLVSLTQEKVIWPQRPSTGKYSFFEEKESRRRARQHSKKSSPINSKSSDIIGPETVSGELFYINSELLKKSDDNMTEWLLEKRTSDTISLMSPPRHKEGEVIKIQDEDLVRSDAEIIPWLRRQEKLFNFYSKRRVEGETYALVWEEWSRKTVLEELGTRWMAILFEEDKKQQLAISYDQKKYVLPVVEVPINGNLAWGLADKGYEPEILFTNLPRMVRFYSLHPLTAFYHL